MTENKPLISVIVPVYNAQTFLKECVESLLKQTYANLEIILVDDGSTDESPSLCESLDRQDGRVTVYHQENAGVFAARNKGLEVMKGRYFTFIDNDDAVNEKYIELLYSNIINSKADIAISSILFDYGCKKYRSDYEEKKQIRILNQTETMNYVFYRRLMYVWGVLYKSEYKNLKFPPINHGADRHYLYRIMKKIKRSVYVNESIYSYRIISTSASHIYKLSEYMTSLKLDNAIINDVKKKYPECLNAAVNNAAKDYIFACFGFSDKDNHQTEKKYIKAFFYRYAFKVIFDKKSGLNIRVYCLLSYLGLWTVKKIHYLVSMDKTKLLIE